MTEAELRHRPWLMDPERDFPEDYVLDNGCYMHLCMICNKAFNGHKHRDPICKLCEKDA